MARTLLRLSEDVWVDPGEVTAIRRRESGGELRILVYHPSAPDGYYVVDAPFQRRVLEELVEER